jgi:hypothetical protein
MAKLRANITYNRRKQESNSTMAHINIQSKEQELPNTNLNEQNKESNSDNVEDLLNIEDEVDNDNNSDDDPFESLVPEEEEENNEWKKKILY